MEFAAVPLKLTFCTIISLTLYSQISYVIVLWCLNVHTWNFTYKDISMTQHSDVHSYHGCFFLFRYFLEWSNRAKITLRRAKQLFPTEVSTARMTWALFSEVIKQWIVLPSLCGILAGIYRRGRGPEPSDSPRKRPRCRDACWSGRDPLHRVGMLSCYNNQSGLY